MPLENMPEEKWAIFQQKYEKLRESEELYRVALSLTDHKVTVVDIPNRTLNQVYDEGVYKGITSSMPDAPDSIIAAGAIHSEDVENYRTFFRNIYDGAPENECTIRLKEENRGWVWFAMHARTIFDEDRRPLKAIIFSEDITLRKRAEIMYEQYYAAVTRDANYVWEVDLDQDLLVNETVTDTALLKHADLTRFSEVVESTFEVVLEEYRVEAIRTFNSASLLTKFRNASREVMLEYPVRVAGEDRVSWVQSTAYMTAAPEGNVNAIICIRDISGRKTEEDRLRQEAERDPLCGLYNRKAFERQVNDLLKNDRRTKGGYLFMIDLDDFKAVNDSYGHVFGDEIIQCLAETLRDCFRSDDILGRVGGDEFMAFVSNIGIESAGNRAAEIGLRLSRTNFSQNVEQPVTLSIGIAEAGIYDGFASLYKKADKALYRAKSNGKGCWALWE